MSKIKSIIKPTLFAVLAALSFCSAEGQNWPDEFQVHKPDFLINMDGNPRGIGRDENWQDWALTQIKRKKLGKDTRTVWTVYSDRDKNPVYSEASEGTKNGKLLNFRDKLYVAEIKNGFALVFTCEYESNYPAIHKEAHWVGWVPLDNLLLWEECPKSHSQIYQKAVVVRDIKKNSNESVEENPPYRLAPDNKPDSRDFTQLAKDLDILFVMKKATIGDETFYLLSKEMNCKGRERVLYGWLPESYVTEWDQRLALEPSHSSTVVSEYNSLGLEAKIYEIIGSENEALEKAKNWSNGSNAEKALTTFRLSRTRMHSYKMRNPILETKTSNILRVASITSSEKDDVLHSKIKAKEEDLKNRLNSINIIFVIDATSSMKRYYAPVMAALENVANLAKDESTIKVGAVVYRDYADAKRLGTIEYKKVTKDIDEVISFLKGIKTESDDADDWEAMFEGISTALDTKKMGYGAGESNFLILVGDAGNQRRSPNGTPWQDITKQIADKLQANQINFTAHQVNHAGKNAYDDFSRQIGNIQNLYSKKIASKLQTEVKFESDANGSFKLVKDYSLGELPIYNTYKYAKTGHSENPRALQDKVIDQIKEFRKKVHQSIALVSQGFTPAGETSNEQLRDVLRLAGWTEDEIKEKIESGGGVKFIGFAPEKCVNARHKIYDYVLFFSQQELSMLINELSKINSSANVSDRQAYYEAFIAMGQAMLGQFNMSEISNMSTDQLLGQIYGVPIELPSTGLNISEIMTVDRDRLELYINEFKNKLTRLKSISNNTYDGRFESNGIVYYWIPITDMPGMTPIN